MRSFSEILLCLFLVQGAACHGEPRQPVIILVSDRETEPLAGIGDARMSEMGIPTLDHGTKSRLIKVTANWSADSINLLVVNSSGLPLQFPADPDGRGVLKSCPSGRLLEIQVLLQHEGHAKSYSLYGCDATGKSVVTLGPSQSLVVKLSPAQPQSATDDLGSVTLFSTQYHLEGKVWNISRRAVAHEVITLDTALSH